MNWWVILIIFVAIIILFKFKHVSHKFHLMVILIIILFFYISFSNILSRNEIEINSISGMAVAGEAYYDWMRHVFDNTRTIVGNVVRMDWSVPVSGG